MRLGVTLRNMGPQSTAQVMGEGARRAEALGFESVWITDHIAIPPDDAQGSGGRYTDPLTTLAWLGGATERIGLGVGVLVAPYRPPLPTAKAIATVQELTHGRLLLGLAVGWMDAEFRAVGVDRRQRGRLTDELLTLLRDCFDTPVVTRHGQSFLFEPKPPAPPIYIGGRPPHALERALRFGHGWLPMARDPESLGRDLQTFQALAAQHGAEAGPVTAMAGISTRDPDQALALLNDYAALGIERLVCAVRYDTLEQYLDLLEALASAGRAYLTAPI
jgi:probable F420-dependent oxidoreductase